jgi:hypothetical protein
MSVVRKADAKLVALAEPVVMRYPAAAFRRDGLPAETPSLVDHALAADLQ